VGVKAAGVTLSPSTLSLTPEGAGKTKTLTAVVKPDNATYKAVTWKSSNENVADYTEDPQTGAVTVTGKTVGTAVIVVTTKDGGYTATCTVTVAIPVTEVIVEPANRTIKVGESAVLSATVKPAGADQTVTWKSGDDTIVKVDEKTGLITGLAAGGPVAVTAMADGKDWGSCAVTVELPSTPLSDACDITQYWFTNPDSIGDIGGGRGSGSAADPVLINITFWAEISGWSGVSAPAAHEDDIKIKYTGKKIEAADVWTKTGGLFYRDYTVYAESGKEKHYRVSAGPSFDIHNLTEWDAARTLISSPATPNGTAANPQVFRLNIVGDFDAPGLDTNTYTITGDYKTVWLTGTKTIRLSSNGSLIRGVANQTFIIDGITLAGKADKTENNRPLVYTIGSNSAVELRSGVIRDNIINSPNVSGGGVLVTMLATFTMSGGTISGNTLTGTGSYGGGVVAGSFTISGGTISGNTAKNGGGGVATGGTFTMTGGTISGNTVTALGGGVFVDAGTFTMEGGTISGNTASSGGGVFVETFATFTMNGGTISGNTAVSGGGVYPVGTFTKTGGTIYGDNDTTHTSDSDENTATSGNGHAVYAGARKRNTTAGPGVALDSTKTGAAGGWE
jgi:hypothetical protein